MRAGGTSASASLNGGSGPHAVQSTASPLNTAASLSAAPSSSGAPTGLSPIATYRHLLSAGSLHPSNPLRVVAHCDVDAAYAQFEAARLGIDSFKVPVAVQQWHGLIAISYKAREYGINRHCDIDKARKLCPDIVNVHVQTIAPGASEAAYNVNPRPETHKVSLDPYRRESRKILAVFKQTCPLGQVEKASIDESYFDLTLEVRKLILARYPHLAHHPTTGKGMDEPLPSPPLIEWSDEYGVIMPVGRGEDAEEEIEHAQETDAAAENDKSNDPALDASALSDPTWTDVALAHGAILMARVRREVFAKLGYTTSGGIASNKTLAKLCSGYRKPNNQTMILPRAVPAFLRDLPVSKIRFLGGKLGQEIGEIYDATTIGDLWSVPLSSMQTHFGPDAHWVHAVLRGVDHAPVSARIASKTMLASKNLRPPIKRPHEALGWLDTLATELVVRLREVWEDDQVNNAPEQQAPESSDPPSVTGSVKDASADLIPTVWPKLLVLRFIRSREGPRSRQCAFPYVSRLKSDDVFKVAERLWNDACEEMRFGQRPVPGSSESQVPSEIVTIALGFAGLERAEAGQKTIERFLAGGKQRASPALEAPEIDGNASASRHWSCEECGERLAVQIESSALDEPALAERDADERLALRVQDHRDYHYALKLSMEHESGAEAPARSHSASEEPPRKKAKAPKRGSLQSFFAKQGTR